MSVDHMAWMEYAMGRRTRPSLEGIDSCGARMIDLAIGKADKLTDSSQAIVKLSQMYRPGYVKPSSACTTCSLCLKRKHVEEECNEDTGYEVVQG